jgi:glycosyltransferase involved in cell wall biosynthesis/serine/threonine protein kinase
MSQEKGPIVSVIIATYNRAQYIKKAIESVLNQTYKNIEIIVIDDGSTDNTKKTLEPYIRAQKIKYIYQENAGSGNARDNGIRNSQGKYIAILDSDDIWCDQNKLKKQVEFLEEHSGYILVGGSMIKINEAGKEIARYIYPENDEDIRELILIDNMFAHSNAVFRKDTWELTGGYCSEGDRVDDEWNLWLKLGKLGKFYNFQEYFTYYLEGELNASKYNIRRNLMLDIKLRKRYCNNYPNFGKAFFIGCIRYLYFFFPFKKQLHPISLKFKRIFLGKEYLGKNNLLNYNKKKTKKIKKAIFFIRKLGINYFIHLAYIYFILPTFMNILPTYVFFYRRYKNLRYCLNLDREILHWKAQKEEILKAGKNGYRLHIDEFGLSKEGLDKVKKTLQNQSEPVIADIDQDGLFFSYFGTIDGVSTISREKFLKKTRFIVNVIVFEKTVAIKKQYKGNRISFLNELSALYNLGLAGCNVPSILNVDFEDLSIIFSYIRGSNLQEQLAQKGALIRDRDIQKDAELMRLSEKERWKKYLQEGKRVLSSVLNSQFIEDLFGELKKIHKVGFELYDIKYGNIIIEKMSQKPFLVDFDSATNYSSLWEKVFSVMRDRDIEKFNIFFNTEKLTYKRIRERIKDKNITHVDKLYAPVYFGYGLRIGKIWDMNVGYGRWHFILKNAFSSLSGKRILSLGANIAFNEIQMLRNGAREVIGVETNSEYIAQGNFVKEVFEWADNTTYNFKYIQANMAEIPTMNLGNFDMVVALCSLYYLDEESISNLVRYINNITDIFILQCNIRTDIGRSDKDVYMKASVEYATKTLNSNGFSEIKIIAPFGYSRPLVIGRKPNKR